MNAQEERCQIINKYVPKLIQQLTKLELNDENYQRCLTFAMGTVRFQRYLSTNSHHIKRKIAEMQEKFVAENCIEYAEHFGALCEEIVQHPLCLQHYEVDVHWSLLDFLLTLAYNPAAHLRRHKHDLVLNRALGSKVEEVQKPDVSYWQDLLRQDFIPLRRQNTKDSDLSDWSELSSTESSECQLPPETSSNVTLKNEPLGGTPFDNIQPPRRVLPFREFDGRQAEEELLQQVQHSWWLTNRNSGVKHMPIESNLKEANCAHLYMQHLQETSKSLVQFDEPETASEYFLLREIIWMFRAPETCKFFEVTTENIKMRKLMTIPSVIEHSLVNYMQQYFLPYFEMMRTLRNFIQSFFKGESAGFQPKTLECYAANLNTLLETFWQKLLNYEQRLVNQKDFETHTLISFRREMSESFNLLAKLHALHVKVVLPQKSSPAHINSVYLLTALLQQQQLATNAVEANLAMSLFLTAVKVFCAIIDTWWTEGRLDDWQREFLVERLNQNSQVVRPFVKDKDTSFFVASNVSEVINKSEFFHILHEYALEAGNTLNLLYEVNKIGDMRSLCANTDTSLYEEFKQRVLESVKKLHIEKEHEDTVVDGQHDTTDKEEEKVQEVTDNFLQSLSTQDEFLLQAFAHNDSEELNKSVDSTDASTSPLEQMNALQIFEFLQKHSQGVLLPVQELGLNTLKRLLHTRIHLANAYVLHLFRQDFQLQKHQQYLRRMLLLEASDIMHNFYTKLFKQIENGENWANSYHLTAQLDDILSSKFPDMSGLFRVDIKSLHRCKTKRAYEAVEELIISYNFSMELAHAFSEADMQQYNMIFRFLLKVKWALHTLEELHFATANKRRPVYAPLEYVDVLFRRLQMLRFWMLFSIQSIHTHLMTHVLQAKGEQLDEDLAQCVNFKQLKNLHANYVRTVCEHCFLTSNFKHIKLGVEQFLNLVNVLRTEWNHCVKYIESQHPLAPELSDGEEDTTSNLDYKSHYQIDEIELSYIELHVFLAKCLNDAVYLRQQTFLSGLSAAFNGSMPQ